MRGPKVNDFGGNRPRTTELREATMKSLRCTRCTKLRYVTPRELDRAAPPRCIGCGGSLEEIVVSKKRHGVFQKKFKPRELQRRCPSCGCRAGSNEHLFGHLKMVPECVTYHIDEGYLYAVDGSSLRFIPSTVHVMRLTTAPTTRPWAVLAIMDTGHATTLGRFRQRYAATDWIRDNLGPVEWAGPFPTGRETTNAG